MTDPKGGGTRLLDPPADADAEGHHGHRRFRRSLWIGLVLLVLGGLAALATLPTRQWLNQRDQMARSTKQLTELQARNAELQTQLDHLTSPQANDDVARKELGLVRPGERAIAVLPAPQITLAALPAEWPFTVIQQLAAVPR